jgi:GT2 family glycosyltransferase
MFSKRPLAVMPASSTFDPSLASAARRPPDDRPGETSPPRVRRLDIVVPCFNRQADLDLLVSDLGALDRGGTLSTFSLRLVIVDNASTPPLPRPPGDFPFPFVRLRLPGNTGGSGGFNAGMAWSLAGVVPAGATLDPPQPPDRHRAPELLWLVDSDARVHPDALAPLVHALDSDVRLVAAGSAIEDPQTGELHEVGGHVDRRDGRLGPARRTAARHEPPFPVDYVAACSALVRADAVVAAGLFPDTFLNGDDVEWFMRMRERTGGLVAAVPASRVAHPHFGRYATWARFFHARNAFGPVDALRLAPWRAAIARFRAARRHVLHGLSESLSARPDLAALHVMGISHAASARWRTVRPADLPPILPLKPWSALPAELDRIVTSGLIPPGGSTTVSVPTPIRLPPEVASMVADDFRRSGLRLPERWLNPAWPESCSPVARATPKRRMKIAAMLRAAWRLTLGPRPDVALIPATGGLDAMAAGRVCVHALPEGFVVRRHVRGEMLLDALRVAVRGAASAARLTIMGSVDRPQVLAPQRRSDARDVDERAAATSVSIVILSHNRWSSLCETLEHLLAPDAREPDRHEIIVVDNGSTDGTPERLRRRFPSIRLVELERNLGVEGFNRGAIEATGDLVLILDDDASVPSDTLAAAVACMATRPELAAITFCPVHPRTGRHEWPFANRLPPEGTDRWPLMGCANLVRRDVFLRVGGYEPTFFLYRNDADLALTLLDLGQGVHCRPDWRVLHQSDGIDVKSSRRFQLATRNWVWLCRRHGTSLQWLLGSVAAAAWACRLAGWRWRLHARIVAGFLQGMVRRPAPAPVSPRSRRRGEPSALSRLLGLRMWGTMPPAATTSEARVAVAEIEAKPASGTLPPAARSTAEPTAGFVEAGAKR